jgi:hypothetical protein
MNPAQILARMIINLVNLYTEQGQADPAHRLGRWLTILQDEPEAGH